MLCRLQVKSYRAGDGLYEVLLPFGTGYLHPAAILGAEELPIPALQVRRLSQHVCMRIFIVFFTL